VRVRGVDMCADPTWKLAARLMEMLIVMMACATGGALQVMPGASHLFSAAAAAAAAAAGCVLTVLRPPCMQA
jgi:hypothetical protein